MPGSTSTAVGASAKLRIYSGAAPANCAAAASGTLLVEMNLPSDWMAAAASASKSKAGTWSGTAGAAGTAGYFRIVDNAGTTAHIQGTCGQGAGDMSLDNTNIANGQTVILGGMIKETEKALRNRVPFFSYIPILGGLFKSNEKQKEKIDLMIFLTPYIIKTPQDATNITNQIINDQQQLSPAELKQLKDNHENYQKSLKKEEVKKEILDPTTLIQGEGQQTPAETTK